MSKFLPGSLSLTIELLSPTLILAGISFRDELELEQTSQKVYRVRELSIGLIFLNIQISYYDEEQ